jgi:hypothetical protein
MADENVKEWTPVCVASTRRHNGESTDQDKDLGYFKSAEWYV